MSRNLDNIMDDIESSLNEDTGKHITRQLFDKLDKSKAKTKSEATDTELKLMTRMVVCAKNLPHLDMFNEIVQEFLLFRISLARQGRKELIEGLKSIADNKTGARAMSAIGIPPMGRMG